MLQGPYDISCTIKYQVFPFFQSQTTKLVIRVRKNTVKSPARSVMVRATSLTETATQNARINYHPVRSLLDP